MDMEEIWRDIKGYDGYQVSNFGRVRSLNYKRTGVERVLSAGKGNNGYLIVNLCKDGKVKQYYIHRLVAKAFLPNPDNLPQVNHKDECKTNNAVSNLEWCDTKYNLNYGTRIKRIVKAESKPVFQYTLDGVLVRSYPSTKEAERQTGYHSRHICTCCNGKRNHHKGFIWSYDLLVPRGKLF